MSTGSGATETRLMLLILARLFQLEQAGKPVHFWRANTGRAAVRGGRTIAFGEPGQADLLGCCAGRLVCIETKSATGRVSADQTAWGERIARSGGIYIVARCLEDAMNPVLALLP